MNKKILLSTTSLCFAYLAFTSYSAGPFGSEGNLTGSGSKAASCSGASCHAAGSAKTRAIGTDIITLHKTPTADASDILIGGYVPGTKYYAKLNAYNTSGLSKFGFQVSCVNASKANAGTLAAMAGSNTAVRSGAINVLEQTTTLNATSLQYTKVFEWTAPPAGTGNVTFYVIVNGVNGNGTTSGDEPSTGLTKTFYEKTTSIKENNIKIAQNIYPNPCQSVLHFETTNNEEVNASICDITGKIIMANIKGNSVDVSQLANGVYLLRLSNDQGQQVATFVKQ